MGDKLTIIKIMPRGGAPPTAADIERWKQIFAQNRMTLEQAAKTGEVEVVTLPELQGDEDCITLVKIGGDKSCEGMYLPTAEDLEMWRQIFEEAKGDSDFKIFTHPDVEISVIPLGKIVAVE